MKNITRAVAKKPLLPIIAAAALLFALWADGSNGRVRAQNTPNTATPTPEVRELPPLGDKLNPPEYPKMDFTLNRVISEAQSGQSLSVAALSVAASSALVRQGERIAVSIWTEEGFEDAIADLIEHAGDDPRHVGGRVVEAYVGIPSLESLASAEGVLSVDAIVPPQPAQTVGNPVSPALSAHEVAVWHAAGVKGAGMKIGIIDVSFEGFAGLRGTHLPSSVNVRCYVDVGDWSSQLAHCANDSLHGTKVAEALYDIAPEAQYYLAVPVSEGDLHDSVEWMINAGVDVINMSLGWDWGGPGDGTSPLRPRCVQRGQ